MKSVTRSNGVDAARLATNVLAPAPVASLLLAAVAWRSAPTAADALRWAAVAIVCAAVIPTLYIERAVRIRRLSDRRLTQREQRPLPVLVGIVAVLAGLELLALWKAPRDLLVLLLAMAVILALALVVTAGWKISIHTSALSGAAVIAALLFGWPWVTLGWLVALVGWARIRLGEHTRSQVFAGALLGATAAWAVYALVG